MSVNAESELGMRRAPRVIRQCEVIAPHAQGQRSATPSSGGANAPFVLTVLPCVGLNGALVRANEASVQTDTARVCLYGPSVQADAALVCLYEPSIGLYEPLVQADALSVGADGAFIQVVCGIGGLNGTSEKRSAVSKHRGATHWPEGQCVRNVIV